MASSPRGIRGPPAPARSEPDRPLSHPPRRTGARYRVAAWASLVLAFCLTACAPQPAPPPPAPEPVAVEPAPPPAPEPPPLPEFQPDRTYAVLEVDDWEAPAVLRTFCDVTVLRRYRLRYNRENWPTCSSRELMVGVARPGDPPLTGVELEDGRRIRVWEIFDLATGPDAPPLAGNYALAARTVEQDTIEIYTGRLPVFAIKPGQIHYLGRMGTERPLEARDVRSFTRAFRARFPEVPRRRLATGALTALEVACKPALGSTEERINGFDCLGQRRRSYF